MAVYRLQPSTSFRIERFLKVGERNVRPYALCRIILTTERGSLSIALHHSLATISTVWDGDSSLNLFLTAPVSLIVVWPCV